MAKSTVLGKKFLWLEDTRNDPDDVELLALLNSEFPLPSALSSTYEWFCERQSFNSNVRAYRIKIVAIGSTDPDPITELDVRYRTGFGFHVCFDDVTGTVSEVILARRDYFGSEYTEVVLQDN